MKNENEVVEHTSEQKARVDDALNAIVDATTFEEKVCAAERALVLSVDARGRELSYGDDYAVDMGPVDIALAENLGQVAVVVATIEERQTHHCEVVQLLIDKIGMLATAAGLQTQVLTSLCARVEQLENLVGLPDESEN